MTVPTLDIRDLRLGFKTYDAYVEVLHGISLSIQPGERVALVGESGSGKSVTARIVLGLLQLLRSARISGSVVFEGRDLDRLSARERRRLRGTRMTMVFQDPTSSLNPSTASAPSSTKCSGAPSLGSPSRRPGSGRRKCSRKSPSTTRTGSSTPTHSSFRAG